mgnify:CR=1 FL=1
MPQQPVIDFYALYNAFSAPTSPIDCGVMCAPHNPNGIPFCCDICSAVPVAYRSEWQYLKQNTALWHTWRGIECKGEESNRKQLMAQTPPHLRLLACRGPSVCERDFRAVSCRQFPFFPYLTSDYRFIGMTYDWEFTDKCWVISNLSMVTAEYCQQFFSTFDHIFSTWLEDMDCYIELSAETREHYAAIHRRVPLLHRNGGAYLISPLSERMVRTPISGSKRFSPYEDYHPESVDQPTNLEG